jgi:hypothetical protein
MVMSSHKLIQLNFLIQLIETIKQFFHVRILLCFGLNKGVNNQPYTPLDCSRITLHRAITSWWIAVLKKMNSKALIENVLRREPQMKGPIELLQQNIHMRRYHQMK